MQSGADFFGGIVTGVIVTFIAILLLVIKFETSDAACIEAHYKKIELESCETKTK